MVWKVSTTVIEQTFTKGSTFRGIATLLRREGRLARVTKRMGIAYQSILLDPPAATEWVAFSKIVAVYNAILDEFGEKETERILRDASKEGAVVLMESFISGIVRLFGATPHSIFSRSNDFAGLITRGLTIQYERVSDYSGRMTFRLLYESDIPPSVVVALRASAAVGFDLLRTKGTISPGKVIAEGKAPSVTYDVAWAKS